MSPNSYKKLRKAFGNQTYSVFNRSSKVITGAASVREANIQNPGCSKSQPGQPSGKDTLVFENSCSPFLFGQTST